MMQCVFTGFPLSGKSSFWKRLQGIIPESLLPSTGITSYEGSVRMDIRGSCGFSVDLSTLGWRKLEVKEEMDGFICLVTQQGHPYEHKRAIKLSADLDKQVAHGTRQAHADSPERKQNVIPEVDDNVIYQGDESTPKHMPDTSTLVQEDDTKCNVAGSDTYQLPTASTVLRQALISYKQTQLSNKMDSASFVQCTDTGGQPEYQEFLSLLIAGSNTVFITFNLEHDLDSYQTLEYLPSVNEDPVVYESPYTVGEMLCQTLISVPIHSSCQGASDEMLQDDHGDKEFQSHSYVFFIGTHKDKVSPERIEALSKELLELIQHTPQFQANIVQKCCDNNLIFVVNNFSPLNNDDDFVEIRRATQKLVYGHHLKVKAPTSWLFTGIVLQNLSETQPMISLEEYQKIAEECGIKQDSLISCLKFLHHTTGALRYYNTEHLNNVVFLKPQLLINVLSHLVSRAFKKTPPKQAVLEDDDITDATKHFKSLSREYLIKIAKDLLVMCPHPNSTAQHSMYYLTCMLPVNKEIARSEDIGSVYFMLDGFVLPIGLGRATITAIAQQPSGAQTPWNIDFKTFQRNSLQFTVSSPTITFQIACSTKHLCLSVVTAQSLTKDICSDVRITVEIIMTEVLNIYKYGQSNAPIVAFTCSNCDTSLVNSHYAILISADRLQCSKSKHEFKIPTHLKHWALVR